MTTPLVEQLEPVIADTERLAKLLILVFPEKRDFAQKLIKVFLKQELDEEESVRRTIVVLLRLGHIDIEKMPIPIVKGT